ncbi:hypothetical protein Glove_736g8 [Diversispora epigaea]|uniref:Uncharacterized protein n=1 Tax=Diversispora epigaea TaxID=1348612 RepID=A0A397G089_9GLOM|nr:hypothetical protein Glove_736g8 [Diversispora epigaea]
MPSNLAYDRDTVGTVLIETWLVLVKPVTSKVYNSSGSVQVLVKTTADLSNRRITKRITRGMSRAAEENETNALIRGLQDTFHIRNDAKISSFYGGNQNLMKWLKEFNKSIKINQYNSEYKFCITTADLSNRRITKRITRGMSRAAEENETNALIRGLQDTFHIRNDAKISSFYGGNQNLMKWLKEFNKSIKINQYNSEYKFCITMNCHTTETVFVTPAIHSLRTLPIDYELPYN